MKQEISWRLQSQCWKIIFEGKRFSRGWSCEGTPESGPYGGSYACVRIGKAEVFQTNRGDVYLSTGEESPFGAIWITLPREEFGGAMEYIRAALGNVPRYSRNGKVLLSGKHDFVRYQCNVKNALGIHDREVA